MRTIRRKNFKLCIAAGRGGMVLALTLVVLVVLSSAAALLLVRVSRAWHRQQYIIDYQQARYGLDSALKYTLSVMPGWKLTLIDRKDAPDFSDLFWMTRGDYEQYLVSWAGEATDEQIEKYVSKTAADEEQAVPQLSVTDTLQLMLEKMLGAESPADPNEYESAYSEQQATYIDPNQIEVPGPYGPSWPNVIKPINIKIGSAKVHIAVEDENAKMPLSWMATPSELELEDNRQAKACLDTFAEWMQMDKEQVNNLIEQIDQIGQKKTFVLNPSPIMLGTQTRTVVTRRQGRAITTRRTYGGSAQELKTRPAVVHATDFAKLFHSSLLDIESLSHPVSDRVFEDESPAKYLGLWGSSRVNINTAPRHVLEAAFTFGGRAKELADKIIQARKEKAFISIPALRDAFYGDADAIDRVRDYIDTSSNFFSIHVESVSGTARVWAVATVIKEKEKIQLLAVMYGR